MDSKTATERLRELLDERGVGWSGFWVKTMQATQYRHDGIGWTATEHQSGKLYLTSTSITPEQAIAATLGDDGHKQAAEYWKGMYEELLTERIGEERGYPEHDGRYECPECGNVVYYDELYGGGWTIYVEDYQIPFNACPNCGKMVER